MLFIFGEQVHGQSLEAGERYCGVCRRNTRFAHITETNYFCVFGIRLVPIEKVANYYQCRECDSAYDQHGEVPTQVPVVQRVLTYLLLGYGKAEHVELAQEICEKITGFEFETAEYLRLKRELDAGAEDLFETLKREARHINNPGTHQIVQAAFLMTHALCEIQHEDRVRINLIGNALGTSLQYVQNAIETVREHRYYGVHRLLPTQAT